MRAAAHAAGRGLAGRLGRAASRCSFPMATGLPWSAPRRWPASARGRAARGGERITLPGRTHSQRAETRAAGSLGIPPWERTQLPLLASAPDGSLWPVADAGGTRPSSTTGWAKAARAWIPVAGVLNRHALTVSPRPSHLAHAPQNSPRPPPRPSPISRQSLDELEQLVEKMEHGEMSLEDSLAAYERGVRPLPALPDRTGTGRELRVRLLSDPENPESGEPLRLGRWQLSAFRPLGRSASKPPWVDALPFGAQPPPQRLHAAMRHAVLGGGKRIRPLLVYATGSHWAPTNVAGCTRHCGRTDPRLLAGA